MRELHFDLVNLLGTVDLGEGLFEAGRGEQIDGTRVVGVYCVVIRGYLPERPTPGHLGASLQSLSTEGGLNATLRAAMDGANTELRAGLDGFRGRLGLEGKTK